MPVITYKESDPVDMDLLGYYAVAHTTHGCADLVWNIYDSEEEKLCMKGLVYTTVCRNMRQR